MRNSLLSQILEPLAELLVSAVSEAMLLISLGGIAGDLGQVVRFIERIVSMTGVLWWVKKESQAERAACWL